MYLCYLCPQTKLGDVGCEFNCCALTDHTQDFKFVVGKPELVQFFTKEGPAQCFGFEGIVLMVSSESSR